MFLLWLSIYVSLMFFFFSFLEWEPLKSCIFMCLGILCMVGYISLGLHVWYSYFIVFIFLSGVMSLMVYFCSLINVKYCFCYNYFFFLFFLFVYKIWVYDCNFFLKSLDFFVFYYEVGFYYIFWIVLMLMLFLSFVSFNLNSKLCLRGL